MPPQLSPSFLLPSPVARKRYFPLHCCNTDRYQVLAGAGNDSLSFRTNAIVNSTLKGGDNSDSIDWTLARGTNLSTNKGADTVAGATLTAASIFAGAGHDTVSVSASTNGFVNGGSGLDSINLRTGSASINGGGLADTITLSGTNMAQVIKSTVTAKMLRPFWHGAVVKLMVPIASPAAHCVLAVHPFTALVATTPSH